MYLNIVLTLLVLLILILFNIFINISNFNNNFNNKTIILNNINWVPVTTQVVTLPVTTQVVTLPVTPPILKFDENSTMVDPNNLDEIWNDAYSELADEVYNIILLTFDSDSNKADIQYKINTNLRYVVMKVIDNNNGGFFIHNGINYHISNFDTSNVKCMVGIIANPVGIDFKYDISKWNVSNVTNMTGMFSRAKINSDINFSDWDVSNVKNMSVMFKYAIINSDINFSDWNVRNVTNMTGMFSRAKINSDINLSDWDVRNVINMKYMFYNTTIESDVTVDLLWRDTHDDVDKSFFDNGVTIVEGGSLILPNNWSTQVTLPVTTQVVTLPVTTQVVIAPVITQAVAILKFDKNSDFIPSNKIQLYYETVMIKSIFYNINILSRIENLCENTCIIDDQINIYMNLKYVVDNIITSVAADGIFTHNGIDYHISNFDTTRVLCMFNIIGNLDETHREFKYDISKWDISNVKDMSRMFYNTTYTSDAPLTWNFFSENLNDMRGMFSYAKINTSIIYLWYTVNVTNMSEMFEGAEINTSISFNTPNVTNMYRMFFRAKINSDINFSEWNVSSVTNMHSMFYKCTFSSDLDLSRWNVIKVKSYKSFSSGQDKLQLPIFNTTK